MELAKNGLLEMVNETKWIDEKKLKINIVGNLQLIDKDLRETMLKIM